MLKNIFKNKTDEQLKSLLKIYTALFIVSIILPIVFSAVSYFLNGKFHFFNLIIFLIIIFWSIINIDFLKKELKNNGN